MNPQTNSSASADHSESEWSFSQMLQRLWAVRVLIVMLPILATCATATFVLWQKSRPPHIYSFYVNLIGIQNDAYPNGTTFSPQDLKSAEVITALAEKYSIDKDKLARGINVNYGNPETNFIRQKYERKLNTRGISLTEIDNINKEFNIEFISSSKRGLMILIDNNILKIDDDSLIKVSYEIPSIWNDIYIDKYNVSTNTSLSNIEINFNNEVDENARLVMAGLQLYKIEDNLMQIANDRRLASIMTERGLSAEELRVRIDSWKAIHYDPSMVKGFTANNQYALAWERQLQLQLVRIQQHIDGIDKNLTRLLGDRNVAFPDMTTRDGTGVDQGVVETIITLVKRSADVEFVKTLLERRQALIEEAATTKMRLDQIVYREGSDASQLPTFTGTAQAELGTIADQYNQLLAIAKKKMDALNGKFFSVATHPEPLSKASAVLKDQLRLMASALAGLLIAVIYGLVGPTIRSAIPSHK